MAQTDKRVTIIIVTHNARHYLPECLESVYYQNYPKDLVKIIVIDNHSSDSTIGYVRESHPKVKLITNNKNFGFAEANNQGYYLAQKQGSDYLVLLNQDTVVESNWLSRLVKLAEKDHKIAAVQPKLLLWPEKQLINSFGNSIHFLGFAYCNKYRDKDQYNITEPFELPYASGAACLLKMSVLKKTGLFDDRLFMYHEDVDLGWKIRLAGYKILLDPLAVVYHKYNYSKAKYKFYYMERNRWIILLQNYRILTLIMILPALILMELGMIFYAIKNGWFKEKLFSGLWLAGHLPSILSHRLNVQFKIRKISDRAILKKYSGSIKFQEISYPFLTYIINPLTEIYFFIIRKIIFW
ncbi:glycosyltransferase family 2 protein [Candidatus Falkowbacteria bacterium]|nr:glycosyltransferase family 2 protein [Candidatus Falkowbacteria bacterium]